MSILDGVVPYGMGPGNHDEPTTYYNQYFPYTRYEGEPWYGGHFGTTNDNNYQLFSAGSEDFLIVHLEFCPASAVYDWADGVIKAHPDRTVIITTHGYLDGSGNRSVGGCSDTSALWTRLVVPNDNVYFVLCGHVHTEYRRTDVVGGRQVHQMLADYQGRTNGGDGWLRILRFVPAEDKVHVQTYSPTLNRYETDADSQFTLDFPMGSYRLIGTASGVASGAKASVVWPDLAPGAEYEWFAVAADPSGNSTPGAVWRFTTAASAPRRGPVRRGTSGRRSSGRSRSGRASRPGSPGMRRTPERRA